MVSLILAWLDNAVANAGSDAYENNSDYGSESDDGADLLEPLT